MGASMLRNFHSYRLVLGEVGRGLAAYCGESVYLDVALTWVVNRTATCPVEMREEGRNRSGYSFRQLASHFWRMVLTSGTRPLRLVALFGATLGLGALALIGWVVWGKVTHQVPVQGWASVMVILLITSGSILFSLGVFAEYLGIAVQTAMGKPLYLVVHDPANGPLGRGQPTPHELENADMEPARGTPVTRVKA
jgi:undecaprenyl-phosphate 4-deoxy-4-formamido-L-arabinose transferase